MLRIAQQRLDPRFVRIRGRALLLEQQLAEQDADADVGERAEGEDPVRRGSVSRVRGSVAGTGSSTSGNQTSSRPAIETG